MASPLALAPLSLEDVARDAFRRRFFLDAFPDEREALELSFAFLHRVRQYKEQLGRPHALQTIAEELVQIYLRDPPEHLCVFLRTPPVAELLAKVLAAVDAKRSTADLFSGVEAHVQQRLERDKFLTFVATPQYQQLCDALRKRRELPLGEILVDARRTECLEQFIAQQLPEGIGNLRFWVDVQTIFLPLIQTTVVSVTLFEEIQATVRRIYNQYLTESSPTLAKMVPETIRKDTLKRVLQLQGEPFSPSRYATLFRPAQEKLWHWLQTTAYPKFQTSPLYVALVVETENLESDRQLRKLSDHVLARTGATSNPHKLSAVVVHIGSTAAGAEAAARITRVVTAPQSGSEAVKYQHEVAMPTPLTDAGVRCVRVLCVVSVEGDGRVQIDHEMQCIDPTIGANVDTMDYLDFLWNWREWIEMPTVLSPSHRSTPPLPSPSLRAFCLPVLKNRQKIHGYALVSWSLCDPDNNTTNDSISGGQVARWLPRFAYVLARKPLSLHRIGSALRQLSEAKETTMNEQALIDTFTSLLTGADASHVATARELTPQISGFCMANSLPLVAFPIEAIFNELSHQTVITVLGALLVGKSLVIVCPRGSALVLIAHALLEMLRPFEWQHLFLPLCPVRTACALADRAFFSPTQSFRSDVHHHTASQPFILGVEAELTHHKSRETSNEPRNVIRDSIYSVQRANLQLRRPPLSHPLSVSCQDADTAAYPPEILQAQAVVVDVDADDVYIPERVDVPEFPQTLVRMMELNLRDAVRGRPISTEDTKLFVSSAAVPVFVRDMLVPTSSEVNDALVSSGDRVRLAVLSFMVSLFGDVPLYACSFHRPARSADTKTKEEKPPGARGSSNLSSGDDTYMIFEADAFLDGKIELGCREFFRQVFLTEHFHRYLLEQHAQFCMQEP